MRLPDQERFKQSAAHHVKASKMSNLDRKRSSLTLYKLWHCSVDIGYVVMH